MMTGAAVELLRSGMHALRRSTTWWTIGIAAFVVLNAAFWPSLEGSETLAGFEDMGALLEAFGAQNLASPAGYLDGQIFALLLPLLFSGMAVAHISLLTAGDEDAGRLELLHALPVSRRAVWLSRWGASTTALAAVAVATGTAVVVCLQVFGFEGVGAGRVVVATGACALLAAFHASLAYAIGGFGASRGRAVGAATGVLVAGYLASFVLPIADALRAARRWSPWYWAVGEQPVLDGVRPSGLVLLAGITVMLVAAGTAALDRRDIRSA